MDFDVEPYEDCKTDFLEIKDGGTKNSPLIGNFRNSVKMVCFQLMDHRQISLLMLGHFFAVLHFYTPWKRQKTIEFLMFSEDIEMCYWTKMG